MTQKTPAPQPEQPSKKQEAPQIDGAVSTPASLSAAYQQLTPRAILQLQKTIGNRATTRLIQQRGGEPHPVMRQPAALSLLRRVGQAPRPESAEEAPIQGVFRMKRDVELGGMIKNVRFIDVESQLVYVEIKSGPGDGVVPYIWVVPLPGKDPSAAVAIRAKISNLSAEEYQLGKWRDDPTYESDWLPLTDGEREKLDEIAAKKAEAESIKKDKMEVGWEEGEEEEGSPTGKFKQGKFQIYMEEVGKKALGQTHTLASLVTGFTAQVSVVPTAKGELAVYKELGLSEQKFTSDQVWVQDIAISDERLNTRFGAKQESHTVSFTLSRNATIRLANRTARELLAHFIPIFNSLVPVVDSKEGQLLLKSVLVGDILQLAQQGKLPIDRWQTLLSTLIRLFYQVYQLSNAATYKRGKATGHGEASARDRLDEDNTKVKGGAKPRAATKMGADAEKMIDVQFRLNSLGLMEYAFAVNHWIDSLKLMYPELMAAHGDDVVNKKLSTPLAKSFVQEVADQQQERGDKGAKAVTTVRDLLEYFDYNPKASGSPAVETGKLVVGDVALPEVPLGRLATDFMANIDLIPGKQGISQAFEVGFASKPSVSFEMDAYTPDQVDIRTVTLGNKERPATKFITSQKSHTVAWTLVRHQMMGFTGKTVMDLLVFFLNNFKSLQKDIKNEDGAKVAEQSLKVVEMYAKKTLHLHQWQPLISALTRWYLIAYSAAESSSYIHPKELDKAEGHGEAWAMAVLRRNEYSLASGEALVNSEGEVIRAAAGLMDAYLTIKLNEKDIVNAYKHWNEALTLAFPTLMKVGGVKIRGKMLDRKIGEGVTFRDLVGSK